MTVELNNDYRIGHIYVREMDEESFEKWNPLFISSLEEKKKAIWGVKLYDERKSLLSNLTLSDIVNTFHPGDLKWKVKPERSGITTNSIARNMGELFYIVMKELFAGYYIPFFLRTMSVSEKQTGLDRRYSFAIDVLNSSEQRIPTCFISFDVQECVLNCGHPKKEFVGLQATGYHIFDVKMREHDNSIGNILGSVRY